MSPPSTIILITGANSGVGYATSQVLASASPDYHVIMASRTLSKVDAALASIHASGTVQGSLSSLQLDVTDEASITAAAALVAQRFGRLDVLVNNAGIYNQSAGLKTQLETTFATNVVGPALVTAAFTPLLLQSPPPQRPYVLHVSSGLGSLQLAADPSHAHYALAAVAYRASKAALNMLAVQDAKVLGAQGVKVFAVCPGLVESNLRGTAAEERSAGGNAIPAETSGRFILSVVQGERDADVGKFVHRDGIWAW